MLAYAMRCVQKQVCSHSLYEESQMKRHIISFLQSKAAGFVPKWSIASPGHQNISAEVCNKDVPVYLC